MGIKQILLHLDHSQGCDNRVQVGLELSKRFDARLLGVFVLQDYIVPAYAEAQISMDLLVDLRAKNEERAKKKISACKAMAKKAGVALQIKLEEGPLTPILRGHSKYADLLLSGQDNPDDPDNSSYAVADDMLLEAACASMVIPHSGKIKPPGERILLAWNASREAARAVRAALPLLQRAKEVVVISSEPNTVAEGEGHPHAQRIADYLEAHGVTSVSSGIDDPDRNPAQAIISQAAEMQADLIVMGAYGHMRLREIILGGVTRELLKTSPLPLLMAH